MKIIVVTQESFPVGMAATKRVQCYLRALQKEGIDCEVLVYRRTEIYGKKPKNIEGKGLFHGIPFLYIGGTPLRGRNAIIRQIDDRLDILRTEKYLNGHMVKGDVLFLYMGGYVNHMLRFMKIAHAKGAYCVRDLCELPYGTGEETKQAIHLRNITLKRQFPELDGIISISDSLKELAEKYAQPTCKHIKVPILVDFDQYILDDKSETVDIPYIFHAGTLYEQKDGFLGMLEAFGKATERLDKPVQFISTGNLSKMSDSEANKFKEILSRYRLEEKFRFTGYISDNDLKDYLSKASLVIINKYRTQQNTYCFSTKLGEYLAAAKPVVITNVGEAMNWLDNRKSAYIIEPEDTDSLADTIVHVFTHPEERRHIGLAGQEVCRKHFDFRNWSKPLVEFLNSLGK